MKLYAHRGNRHGSNPKEENTRNYVYDALRFGYCAEVDVIYKDGKIYLGHDTPQEEIQKEFLEDDRILVHAKTVETYNYLFPFKNIHSFFQKDDGVSVTTWGKRLYHASTNVDNIEADSIYVDLQGKFSLFPNIKAYGVITDRCGTNFYQNTNWSLQEIFDLLILDVDGVMTDGTKVYGSNHKVIAKQYCDRDFTAIKRFKSAGIQVCLLTGCSFNKGMADKRGLACFNAKDYCAKNVIDKTAALDAISRYFNVAKGRMAYVGDDYYDCSLLDMLRWSYAPQDASEEAKRSAKEIIKVDGGRGVIAALYESVKSKLIQRYPYE